MNFRWFEVGYADHLFSRCLDASNRFQRSGYRDRKANQEWLALRKELQDLAVYQPANENWLPHQRQ